MQEEAYLLLPMCLSMPCPVKMAALVAAVLSPDSVSSAEPAVAHLNIRLKIRAIHYGLASRIAQVAGRELMNTRRVMVL